MVKRRAPDLIELEACYAAVTLGKTDKRLGMRLWLMKGDREVSWCDALQELRALAERHRSDDRLPAGTPP